MSGTARYLNLYDREIEEKGGMAPDDAFEDLLASRLSGAFLIAYLQCELP